MHGGTPTPMSHRSHRERRRVRGDLVPASGYRLGDDPRGALCGELGLREKIAALPATAVGMRQARSILRAERVDLVLGFGGY